MNLTKQRAKKKHPRLRFWKRKALGLAGSLWETVCISACASMATFPVLVLRGMSTSLYALVSGAAVLWLVEPILLTGLGAALTNENVTCEVICDGLHICDEMLGIYFKVKSTDKFMMVSDCTALSGAPVGKYEGIFEGMALNVTPEGFVLTDTGRLCGSSQPVLFDIGNLVNNVGIPLETCLKMACLNPCIKYGFADRKGTIEVGKDADLVVISDDYQAQVTYAEGRKVYDRSTEGKIFNADYLNR